MIIIFGQRRCGKVDHVPGFCYVATMFAHLNYLPLIPLRAYVVLEGSENGNDFRGKEITLSWKSVFVGYLRTWLGLVIFGSGIFAGIELAELSDKTQSPTVASGLLGLAAIGAVLTLFTRGNPAIAFQTATHLCSGILFSLFNGLGPGNPVLVRRVEAGLDLLLVANLALLLYGLTRWCNRAGQTRRRELLQELGIDIASEDDPHEEDRWEQWDRSASR